MVLDKAVMNKLNAGSTSVWEDLFLYRMSLIEEKLSPPESSRHVLEEGYMAVSQSGMTLVIPSRRP